MTLLRLRSRRNRGRIATMESCASGIGVLALLLVLCACSPFSGDGTATPDAFAKSDPVEKPPRNAANERILSLPAHQQARVMGTAIGKSCVGKTAFFMGLGDEGSAFWSVRCANGRTYAVAVAPDEDGSTTSMSCASFTAKTHVQCFKKFSDKPL